MRNLLFICREVHISDGKVGMTEWSVIDEYNPCLKKVARLIMPYVGNSLCAYKTRSFMENIGVMPLSKVLSNN